MNYEMGERDLPAKDYFDGETDACADSNMWNREVIECVCDEDACNGSPAFTFSAVTLIVTFAAKLLF